MLSQKTIHGIGIFMLSIVILFLWMAAIKEFIDEN